MPAQLRVVPGQGLVAMGALHDDLLDPVGLKRGDVLAGQHEVDELVAHSPRRVPAALLFVAQDGEAHTRLREQRHQGRGHLAIACVEGPGAAGPVEVLGIGGLGDGGHIQPLGPLGAGLPAQTPRVAVVLHVAEGGLGLRRERAFHGHLVGAHLHHLRHVLHEGRARLHAGAAGGAGPQGLGRDDRAHERAIDDGALGVGEIGVLKERLGRRQLGNRLRPLPALVGGRAVLLQGRLLLQAVDYGPPLL